MNPMRKSVIAAAMAGSLLVGGAAGVALFGPRLAGAQTTTTVPGSSGNSPNGSKMGSNEDPTHEAAEDAAKAAPGSSGQGSSGGSATQQSFRLGRSVTRL